MSGPESERTRNECDGGSVRSDAKRLAPDEKGTAGVTLHEHGGLTIRRFARLNAVNRSLACDNLLVLHVRMSILRNNLLQSKINLSKIKSYLFLSIIWWAMLGKCEHFSSYKFTLYNTPYALGEYGVLN